METKYTIYWLNYVLGYWSPKAACSNLEDAKNITELLVKNREDKKVDYLIDCEEGQWYASLNGKKVDFTFVQGAGKRKDTDEGVGS